MSDRHLTNSERNFCKPSQSSLSDPETKILFSDDSISSLPDDVADALQFITSGLQTLTLHPRDIFTHDLLFHVDIMGKLYISFKSGYTERNFHELLAFAKTIRQSQPSMSVFTPTGYKTGQKRICIMIKHWTTPKGGVIDGDKV